MIQTNLPESWQKRWRETFTTATEIQEAVYHPLQEGKNVVGISPTGSGKTIAYLLPLLQKVAKGAGSQLLIVTSSQELAMQVAAVARTWGGDLGLQTATVIGGANQKRQQEKLKTHPEIIVGTPGRLVELMDNRKLKAHQIRFTVLDEADQLLGLAAKPLLLRLVKHLPRTGQLSFFSATADAALAEIETLTEHQLEVVDVTATDTSKGEVKHCYLVWPQRKKIDALRRVLNQKNQRCLIFFNELADLGAAEEKLLFHGLPVASLASDQGKLLRKHSLTAFREGKVSGLLTTDVAARGLDIEGLDLVVNESIPVDAASYLHRSGRVGRMGRKGLVVTVIAEHQQKALQKLVKHTGIQLQEIYLYEGRFQMEAPVKEKATPTETHHEAKPSQPKQAGITKRQTTPELKEKALHTEGPTTKPRRSKNRIKKQKDKGKRRK